MDLDTNIKLLPVNECSNAKMIIYMLYNKVTKKAYIGKTKHGWVIRRKTYEYDIKNPKKQSLILRSLRKHGWDSFLIAVLEENVPGLELLNEIEKQYIKKYNTNINGYNMTAGGDGGCSAAAAKNNSKRMKQQVRNGTFILQTPAIKEKCRIASSNYHKSIYKNGTHNFQSAAARKKAIISRCHSCILQIIRNTKVVFKKKYDSKKEILTDGFPLNIIYNLRKKSSYLINFIPPKRGPVKLYTKGDIITIKYL